MDDEQQPLQLPPLHCDATEPQVNAFILFQSLLSDIKTVTANPTNIYLFKVKNRNTKTTSLMLFWCFYY